MTLPDHEISGILVSGVTASDAETAGIALASLGLTTVLTTEAMRELAQRVLRSAGGTWEAPFQISPSELARLGEEVAEEARRHFREALDEAGATHGRRWVWSDPAHSHLAPLWAQALGILPAIVHVHRDPVTAAAAIGRDFAVGPGEALTFWERYNRAALVSCDTWPSLLVGAKTMRDDPEAVVGVLSSFIDDFFGIAVDDTESALNSIKLHQAGRESLDGSSISVPASLKVLDQILDDLEGVIRNGADDNVATVPAFAHLSELYDAEYYREDCGGVPYSRDQPHWLSFFGEVADNIVDAVAPKTAFDAGCAIGLLVEALRARGVDARGIDISKWAIGQVPEALRAYCQLGSVTDPIEGHYDLITCVEVLEHLPAADASLVVENFCAHADAVLFSSTPDDFDEPTHLNVETTSYWAKKFAAHGFYRDPDHDASYLAPQATLFRRATEPLEVVAGYERVLWRLKKEHADRADQLQAGWQAAVDRVAELDELLIEKKGLSDERTVGALERIVNAQALNSLVAGPPVTAEPDPIPFSEEDYHLWRGSRTAPTPSEDGPLISIIVPVFNPVAEHLAACIRSVRAQTYRNWELLLVNVSDAIHVSPICERFAAIEPRVRVLHRDNIGIAENSDAGVSESTGEWVGFLDHDDTLEPHALAAVVRYLEDHREASFVYSDEDKLSSEGHYVEPFFKPDWSPDLLRDVNYICHFVCVTRALYDEVGGLRPGFDGAQDYDFVLRATGKSEHVGHVADVLYHWRQHPGSTASDVEHKPDAHSAGRRALEDFARRRLPDAWLEPGANRTTHRIRYPLRYEKVSIIVPFRDRAELTDACVRSIADSAPMLPIEMLLVSNQSKDDATFRSMRQWEEQFEWVKVLEYEEEFNFQRLNNRVAQQAEGDLLLFLNNDVEAMHTGWLEALAEHAQRPEVGAVGARLFYPDGLVQHAGVAVGIGGLADHPWAGQRPDTWTPAGPSYWTRDFLAVTAACLMLGREKFEEVGGFDERFQICGGDVDLCLRLVERGYWNVMTPFARLVHHESASRQKDPPETDVQESLRAYAPFLEKGDPFFNPNLTRSNRSCRIDAPSLADENDLNENLTFAYDGFDIPVNLARLTGGGPETWDHITVGHLREYERHCPIQPDHCVLDVGCGVGRDAIGLSRVLGPKGRYIGIDIIRPSIEWAQRHIGARFPNFEFHCLNIQSQIHNPDGTLQVREVTLPVETASVDRIILHSVFTHMFEDDIVHYLSDFRRVLRPGGLVFSSWFVLDDESLEIARSSPGNTLDFRHSYGDGCLINDELHPEGAVGFTPAAFERILRRGGFELEEPVDRGYRDGGQDIAILRPLVD